jgi:broad specificity phosphatase PhoE
MSVVYLVRHGQASFGAEEYDQLSTLGFEQSRRLGAALRERLSEVHAAITGTQKRHQQTADACLEVLGLASVRRGLSGLNEFSHQELLARFDPRYADPTQLGAEVLASDHPRRAFQEVFVRAVARWSGGRHDAEYGETWSSFRRRCLRSLDEVLQGLGSSETALVFSSGGPISVICQELLGLDTEATFRLSWTLVNCGVTKLLQGPSGLRLSSLNEHGHFEGPNRPLLTYR